MPAPRPLEGALEGEVWEVWSMPHHTRGKRRARESPPQPPPLPRWINLDIIRSWITNCNEKHGDHCQRARLPGETQGLPRWLIHVSEKRVVPLRPEYRYVALSYVWGRSTGHDLQLLMENLESFQEEKALERMWDQVPATIQHAIELVRHIGETYIWVDRLCIVQDDLETKQEQINQMAFIYGNAYFTLVATAAYSAEEGLRGIKDVSPSMHQDVWPERANMDHYGLVAWSPWTKRGWTLQELVFSQRSLFFHNNEVTWECHCAIWHERMQLADRDQTSCLGTYSPDSRGFRYSPWPDLQEFHQLATSYSRRQLTFSSDILPAFAGITTALSQSFSHGFLFGLPEIAFDVALLWRSAGSICQASLLNGKPVPSWSWMICLDLHIDVDLSPWASGFEYMAQPTSEQSRTATHSPLHVAYQQEWNSRWNRKRPPEGVLDGLVTESICKWYVKDRSGDRRITNDLEKFKACSTDPSLDLPPGWQRDGGLFYHPIDPQRRFRYPVPLITDENLTGAEKEPSFLIKTQTERAFFYSKPVTNGQSIHRLEGDAVVDLYTSEGTWVGCLRAQTRSILWLLLCRKFKCELVAISRGHIDLNAGGWSRLDEYEKLKVQEREDYKFYNVLLIEWKDGVAYRQGIGRVDRAAWEAEFLETIELVLG